MRGLRVERGHTPPPVAAMEIEDARVMKELVVARNDGIVPMPRAGRVGGRREPVVTIKEMQVFRSVHCVSTSRAPNQ